MKTAGLVSAVFIFEMEDSNRSAAPCWKEPRSYAAGRKPGVSETGFGAARKVLGASVASDGILSPPPSIQLDAKVDKKPFFFYPTTQRGYLNERKAIFVGMAKRAATKAF
jgi:hypothetical protein